MLLVQRGIDDTPIASNIMLHEFEFASAFFLVMAFWHAFVWSYPFVNESELCVLRKVHRARKRIRSSGVFARLAVVSVVVLASLAAVGSFGTAARASTGPELMPAAGQFVPLTPVTVLDTRNGTGGVAVAKVAAGATVTFPVTGIGSIPATGVSDVFEEISALNVTGSGSLDAYNADDDDPGIWTLPITAGQSSTVADMTQVGLGGYVSVTNEAATGAADVVVRVMGYVQTGDATTAGDTYVALPDHGVLDTKTGLGDPNGIAEIPSGGSVTFGVTGQGVPADADGVAIYLGTAADATVAGFLSVSPAGATDPGARVLDYQPGQQVHNLYFGAMSSSGQLTLTNHGGAPVDVRAAVQGYLVSPTASEAGDTYTSVAPARIVDTRTGNGGVAAVPVPANGSITFPVGGVADVPSSGVSAVAESVAAISPTATGYLTSYPAGGTDPLNAVVNYIGSDAQDNDLTTPLVSSVSPTGRETITNHSTGTVDVVVTIKGYYTAPAVPAEPALAEAGIDSSGTVTATWQVGDNDGGAAITGYRFVLYNSDGSVNQSATYDPGTTTFSASGLDPTAAYTVGVTAVNAAGSSIAANAAVNLISADSTVAATQSANIGVDMGVDSSTGDLTLSSVNGDISTSTPGGTITSDSPDTTVSGTANVYPSSTGGLGSYACVDDTNSTIATHTPWHEYSSKAGTGTFDFTHFEYTKANAKLFYRNNGTHYEAFESMLCTVGGGEPAPNMHMWFAGSAVALRQTVERKIGQKWGSGTTGGSVITTLNFQLTAGKYATIGASVPVTTGQGTYTGDIGADGRFPGYPWSPGFNPNRTNTYFITADNWIWDGTSSYEGNTSQVLAMWPMGTTGNFDWLTWSGIRVFACKSAC